MSQTRILAAALLLAAASAGPMHAQTIEPGQTISGALSASDPTLVDGSHYDLYRIAGVTGQAVTVTLRSSAFDAYLAVGRMSGGEFESLVQDDDGAGGTDSRVTVTFPAADEYLIRANSLSAGETGDYTLDVASASASASAPVSTSVPGSSPSPSPSGTAGDIVDAQLDSAVVLMRSNDLLPLGSVLRGSLPQGGSAEMELTLPRATLAMVFGVCDAACSDMDLVILGPDGTQLDSDMETDDVPIVALESAVAGTYRVRISMPGCGASTCSFGLRAFGN